MKKRLDKWALVMTIVFAALILWILVVFVLNATSKSVKHKSFYWFGWCPVGTSDKFDQSQNAFTENAYIKQNEVCCATGNYGVVTKGGRNICCRNKFNCLND